MGQGVTSTTSRWPCSSRPDEEAIRPLRGGREVFKAVRADAPDHERGNPDTGPLGDALQSSLQRAVESTRWPGALVNSSRPLLPPCLRRRTVGAWLKKLLDIDDSEGSGSGRLLALAAEPEVDADLILATTIQQRSCGHGWCHADTDDIHFVERRTSERTIYHG